MGRPQRPQRPGRTPGSTRTTPHRDLLTFALYASILCGAMIQGGLGALLPYMGLDMPMSHTVESLHITGLAVGGLIASAVAEPARRRFGRGRVLVGGAVVCAVGAALLAVAPVPAVSAAAMPFVGFGVASTLIAGQVLLVALHRRHGPRMIGELNVAYGVGAVIAATALPVVAASVLGWRGFAGAAAVLLLVIVLPMVVLGVGRTSTEATVEVSADAHASAGRVGGALAVMVLCVTVEWAFMFWLATHLTQVAGLPHAQASVATAAMWFAVVAARLVGSRLLGVVSPGALLTASLSLGIVATVVLSVVTTPGPAVVAGVLAGLGAGNLYAGSIAYVIRADPTNADAAVARGSLFAAVGLLVAPLTLGAVADVVGLKIAFAGVVTLGTTGALVLLAQRRSSRSPSSPQGAPLAPPAPPSPVDPIPPHPQHRSNP